MMDNYHSLHARPSTEPAVVGDAMFQAPLLHPEDLAARAHSAIQFSLFMPTAFLSGQEMQGKGVDYYFRLRG